MSGNLINQILQLGLFFDLFCSLFNTKLWQMNHFKTV